MSFYETVFIVRQDTSTQQVENLADQFSAILNSQGGKVTKRESWGLRNLAYRIKKNRKGHYILFNIDAPAEALHEMERQMRLNEDILRYLTVSLTKLDERPSPILQGRSGKEGERERGRSGREREVNPRFGYNREKIERNSDFRSSGKVLGGTGNGKQPNTGRI